MSFLVLDRHGRKIRPDSSVIDPIDGVGTAVVDEITEPDENMAPKVHVVFDDCTEWYHTWPVGDSYMGAVYREGVWVCNELTLAEA